MKCFRCDKPATLVNHTQHAGTHYWCDAHVPQEDRDECTPIPPTLPPLLQDLPPHMPDHQWLLDKLQEEAAEVIQAVSKIRRFGPHNHH